MAQRSTTPGTSAARSPPGSEDIQNIKRRKLDNKFTAPGAKPNLRLNNMVEEKIGKYFGCLHEPWERMRWQKAFCRVCRTRFWVSELIFCRDIPLGRIF